MTIINTINTKIIIPPILTPTICGVDKFENKPLWDNGLEDDGSEGVGFEGVGFEGVGFEGVGLEGLGCTGLGFGL